MSFRGLAFNVTLDFEHFSWIHPCNLSCVCVTSVALESKGAIYYGELKKKHDFSTWSDVCCHNLRDLRRSSRWWSLTVSKQLMKCVGSHLGLAEILKAGFDVL